jgi:ATP-dependent Lon protease
MAVLQKNKIKNELQQKNVVQFIDKKIDFYKNIIEKTSVHVQKNKLLDILGINNVNSCIEKLFEINKNLLNLNNKNTETTIQQLQNINNDISSVLKNYGTYNFEDLLIICFGNNNKLKLSNKENDKLEILKIYFHPTGYKVLNKKDNKKIHDEIINEINENNNLICFDVNDIYKQFHMKVYGIQVYIHDTATNKTLIIFGIIDDIIIPFLNNNYIKNKINEINQISLTKQNGIEFNYDSFKKFVESFTLKDYLIHENEKSICNKFFGYITHNNIIQQKQISQSVKDFIMDDTYNKRNTIINLLIFSYNYENQYLAYLLYDLLSNDSNGNLDTQEQIILFDSFPWLIKKYFKDAMKKTIEYTNELSNFDINKIPLEQQICLLKVDDYVKEKAMMKLKEVKAKSDDSGSKARQYLDGLLKIPFNIYKKEPILNIMNDIKVQFNNIYTKFNIKSLFQEIPYKEKYSNIEILKYVKKIQNSVLVENKNELLDKIKINLLNGNKKMLINNIKIFNSFLSKNDQIIYTNLNKETLKEKIKYHIEYCKNPENNEIFNNMINHFLCNNSNSFTNLSIIKDINKINDNLIKIKNYTTEIRNELDKSVYGHDKAKRQLERIIGQWINGEQDGYCFGFEGPPGVGKTSLAKKGLSNCLKDEKGNNRPFAMIQMGGDSNGSTLHGHSYTYVGSTWGSIVQILMDKKCMNPIIFIDEIDKISKTENGKEIVGILTHLLDPTQNDSFQDKYFNGIHLDLSKALFILSYNDVDAIDKILLDRIHRIKFENLSLEEKIIICNKHILPEIYVKMGLNEMINISNDVLKYIIDEHTSESGVRKLKELLFEIISEINLDILKNNNNNYDFPIEITIKDIKNNFLKNKKEMTIRKVPTKSIIGYVNGMYATSLGTGGTLPIHASFFPSDKFLELKLTGLQQEVMRESMHISLTVAWNLTKPFRKELLREKYEKYNKSGINIHTGDGSVSKDGPSGGCAITCAIYSLLNESPINPEFGITGEIQLSGEITEIGGLSSKIIGSLKSNIKSFIFPKENEKDFNEFMEKHKNDENIKGINFHMISHVNEAISLIMNK